MLAEVRMRQLLQVQQNESQAPDQHITFPSEPAHQHCQDVQPVPSSALFDASAPMQPKFQEAHHTLALCRAHPRGLKAAMQDMAKQLQDALQAIACRVPPEDLWIFKVIPFMLKVQHAGMRQV